jgi:hypothetical protein
MAEERILTPSTGRLMMGLTLEQYDIQQYLDKKMANGQDNQAIRINNWLIAEALSVYGTVRGATFLLARKCERNVELALANAKVLLKRVLDHLEHNEQDLEEARELYEKLVELEGATILMMGRCTGIEVVPGDPYFSQASQE